MTAKAIPDYVHQHFTKHLDLRVRPPIWCADGASLSVQASKDHYCSPRVDGAERYGTVEIGYPCGPRGGHARPRSFGAWYAGVCGWVAVSEVNRWIHRHGGIKENV